MAWLAVAGRLGEPTPDPPNFTSGALLAVAAFLLIILTKGMH